MGVMELQCEEPTPIELGHFCLAQSLIPILFNSGEGDWNALLGRSLYIFYCGCIKAYKES